MRSVTYDQVVTVIRNAGVDLEWEKIIAEKDLTEQGADSLDMINISFALQEEYHIEITDEAMSEGHWSSTEKIVTNLNLLLAQK